MNKDPGYEYYLKIQREHKENKEKDKEIERLKKEVKRLEGKIKFLEAWKDAEGRAYNRLVDTSLRALEL